MKPRARTPSRRPTAAQVRAWLQTVLHPLSRMAAVTRNRLEQGSLTYRHHLEGFELLGPSAGALSPVYMLNFEQAARHLPRLLELVHAYDAALFALRDACRDADRVLRAHPKVLATAASGAGAGVSGLLGYLAEYTINNHRELPSGYTLRELWSREGRALLALRDGELGRSFELISTRATALRNAATALDDYLRATMLDLADRHGLPPVDPDALAS